MIESMAEIVTPDGRMDAFVTHPQDGGPFPSVLILMDIWGLREELFDVARRVAVTGYHCIVPNFYYRQGPVRFGSRDERGRMKSFDSILPEEQARLRAQMALTKDELAMADLRSVLEFLRSEPAKAGPKGLIGYCLGGRYALQAAAYYPEDFLASASLHGTRLVSDQALSPHKLAAKCRGEIYCGFAEHDDLAPPATRQALEDAFARNPNIHYCHVVHAGAEHGYALPDRDVYDKQAGNRDWENIFAMLRRMLGPGATSGRGAA
jgi:carboxymethylenebutenolidase